LGDFFLISQSILKISPHFAEKLAKIPLFFVENERFHSEKST